MSELSNSDFIYLPTFAEYIMCQDDFDQQLALMSIYRDYCKTRNDKSLTDLEGHQSKFPAVLGHIWTADETLYALSGTQDADWEPADHLLVAARLHEGDLEVDELEITGIRYARSDTRELGIDKVVGAYWSQARKHVSLHLGHSSYVITRDEANNMAYSPDFD